MSDELFISPDTIVQAPEDPQTLNRYSYCRNNPLIYTDPSGHIFGIDDVLFGSIIFSAMFGAAAGSILNASIAGITGGDIGQAFATGAISGAFFGGVGALKLTGVAAAGAHAVAGAASGAINAGITGGDPLQSAAIGGISAGVAKYTMGSLLPKLPGYAGLGGYGKLGLQGATAVATGTVMGGISAEVMGRDFVEGAALGAWTSAYGFFFNQALSRLANHASNGAGGVTQEGGSGKFIGGVVGGTVGGTAATALLPGGPLVVAVGTLLVGAAASWVGAEAGALFDRPGAGQLNYAEDFFLHMETLKLADPDLYEVKMKLNFCKKDQWWSKTSCFPGLGEVSRGRSAAL